MPLRVFFILRTIQMGKIPICILLACGAASGLCRGGQIPGRLGIA
jgi:hypothetical protein